MSEEGLSTLANVCDAVQKLRTPVSISTDSTWTASEIPFRQANSNSESDEHNTTECLYSDMYHYTFPRSYSAPSVSENDYNHLLLDPHLLPSSSSFFTEFRDDNHKDTPGSLQNFGVLQPFTYVQGNYSNCHSPVSKCTAHSFTDFPTPPPTPDSQAEISLKPLSPNPRHNNPLQRNAIANAIFEKYLEETWPREGKRTGGGIIRASLYAKITNTLLGGVAPARLRQWVKRSEFFLTDSSQGEARLAVPVYRLKQEGTTQTAGKIKHLVTNSYRLVAKLEDFVHIIGLYHNDEVGHHGIRKTHAMVSFHVTPIDFKEKRVYLSTCKLVLNNEHRYTLFSLQHVVHSHLDFHRYTNIIAVGIPTSP